jgi:transposase
MRKAYQTDLSDAEWFFLEPLLPLPNATGRPKTHSTREILLISAQTPKPRILAALCNRE